MIPIGLLEKLEQRIQKTGFQCDIINAIRDMRVLKQQDIIFLFEQAYLPNSFEEVALQELFRQHECAKDLYRCFTSICLCIKIVENLSNIQKMSDIHDKAIQTIYKFSWSE